MDKQFAFDKIALLADEIESTQMSVEKNREEIEELDEQLKLYVLDKQTELAEKEGPDGKKLYSNETKRQVAFKAWAETDDKYNQLKSLVKELRKNNFVMQLTLEKKRNHIRAYEVYSRI